MTTYLPTEVWLNIPAHHPVGQEVPFVLDWILCLWRRSHVCGKKRSENDKETESISRKIMFGCASYEAWMSSSRWLLAKALLASSFASSIRRSTNSWFFFMWISNSTLLSDSWFPQDRNEKCSLWKLILLRKSSRDMFVQSNQSLSLLAHLQGPISLPIISWFLLMGHWSGHLGRLFRGISE